MRLSSKSQIMASSEICSKLSPPSSKNSKKQIQLIGKAPQERLQKTQFGCHSERSEESLIGLISKKEGFLAPLGMTHAARACSANYAVCSANCQVLTEEISSTRRSSGKLHAQRAVTISVPIPPSTTAGPGSHPSPAMAPPS